MEVSGRALAALSVVSLGFACAALWPRHDAREPTGRWRTPERAAVSALGDSVSRLRVALGARQSRRLLDSLLQRYPEGRAPAVLVVGGGEAAAFVPDADSFLTSLDIPSSPAVPVHILLVDGATVTMAPAPPLDIFALLSDGEPGGCTVVRGIYRGSMEYEALLDRWLGLPWAGAAGPCWYLATFGSPGPGVRSWLNSRYWDVAEALPGRHDPLLSRDAADTAPNRLVAVVTLFSDSPTLFGNGLQLLAACAFDRPALCESLLFAARPVGRLPPGVGGSGRFLYFSAANREWGIGLPSGASTGLLAMMVEDLGQERFNAFWTSSAPVAEAFESAAGESFGDWFQSRLKRELRAAGLPDHPLTASWPSAVAMLALVLGGTLWQAQRRVVR